MDNETKKRSRSQQLTLYLLSIAKDSTGRERVVWQVAMPRGRVNSIRKKGKITGPPRFGLREKMEGCLVECIAGVLESYCSACVLRMTSILWCIVIP